MAKRLLVAILLICAYIPSFAQSRDGTSWWNTEYNTTEGKEFWVTFMFNYGNTEDDLEDLNLRIFATARENTQVTIHYADGSFERFNVLAYSRAIHNIDLSKGYIAEADKVLEKGIYVTSNKPISLYAVSQNGIAGSQDATNVLPLKALEKEYVIQTYGTDGVATEFALVTTDYTSNISLEVIETNTVKGTSTTKTLNTGYMKPGDVFLHRSQGARYSLSGSKVCSDIPIAIFQGGQHSDIPFNASTKNHIYSQAAPTDMWGKTIVATGSSNQTYDYLRFTTAQDNTIIQLWDGTKYAPIDSAVEALTTIQDTIYSPLQKPVANVYSSNKVVECFTYMTDYNLNASGLGASAMAMISPMEQCVNSMVFSTLDADNIQQHYCNIVTYTKSKNDLTIRSNKEAEKSIASYFVDITGTPYSIAQIPIDTGAHFIRNKGEKRPDNGFIINVYGLGKNSVGRRESYAYSAGSRVNRSADLLMNKEYTDLLKICENDPVLFEPIVRYDYDNLKWQFIDESGIGYDTIVTRRGPYYETVCEDYPYYYYYYHGQYCYTRTYYEYDTIIQPRIGHEMFTRTDKTPKVTFPHDGTWNVNLIIRRHTPLCNNIIADTVKATVIAYPIYDTDADAAAGGVKTLCYGDEPITVKYSEKGSHKTLTVYPDTTKAYYHNQKWVLDSIYEFVDSLQTGLTGCDSVVHQMFVIRPTYDTVVADTICVNHLPYIWRPSDSSHEEEIVITLPNNKKNKLNLTIGAAFRKETIDTTITLHTKYGCDSVVTMHLNVLPIYTKIDSAEYCQDSINTSYKSWPGHINPSTGRVINSTHHLQYYVNGIWKDTAYISIRRPGDYRYRDSLSTKVRCKQCEDKGGCDSIYYLNLHVKDHVIDRQVRVLCDDSYVIWEGEIHMGANCPKITSTMDTIRHTESYVSLKKEHPSTQEGHCDSTFTMTISFCKSYPIPTDDIYHICEDETHKFVDGKTYSWKTINHQIGRYVLEDTILTTKKCGSGSGCDSAVRHIVYVHPIHRDTTDTVVCMVHDGYFNWHTHTISDSVWDVKNAKRIPMDKIPISSEGEFMFIDSLKTVTCTNCQNGVGCDSVWVLKIKTLPSFYHEDSTRICDTESFTWQKHKCGHHQDTTLTNLSAGTYILWDSLHNMIGCDSIYKFTLHVDSTYRRYDTLTIMDNQFVRWGDQDTVYAGDKAGLTKTPKTIILPAGTYEREYHYSAINSCDSAIYLHLVIYPTFQNAVYDTVCQTDLPYNYPDPRLDRFQNLTSTGHYRDTLLTIYGGDSIIDLYLQVNPTSYHEYTQLWCKSAGAFHYGEHGQTATTSGTYQETLITKNHYGCDSVLIVHLSVLETMVDVQYDTICDNEEFNHPDSRADRLQHLKTTGIYKDTIESTIGCDSVIELHLQVWSTYEVNDQLTICDNEPYNYHGHVFAHLDPAASPYYLDTTLASVHKCDSVVHLTVYVYPTYQHTEYDTICESDLPYQYKDSRAHRFQNLMTTGHYRDTIPTVHGCDSIIDLYLQVNPTSYHEYTQLWCKSAGAFHYGEHGQTATTSGTYQETLITKNHYGCDSVLIVHLSVLETMVDVQYDTICDNEEFNHPDSRADRLQHLKTTGIYKDTLESTIGCDSVIELHLQVWPTYEVNDAASICDNEAYNYRGHVFDHVQASLSPYRLDTMLHSIYGCDSLVHFALHVYPTYLFETTKLMGSNEQYEWRGRMIDGADYQGITDPVIFWDSIAGGTKGHHCDSVYKLTLQVAPSFHFYDEAKICSDEQYRWVHLPDIDTTFQGMDLSPKGVRTGVNVFRDTLKTVSGCDSIFELTLRVDSAYLKVGKYDTTRVDICANETYHFQSLSKDTIINNNGDLATADKSIRIYLLTGVDTTIHGCDSVVCHKVYIHPIYDFTQKTYICQDTVNTQWEWIDDQGGSHGKYPRDKVGVFHLGDHQYTKQGCDSIFGIELHVMPIYRFDTTLYICESDSVSWQNVLFVGSQFASYGKTYDASQYDSVRQNMSAGEYASIVRHHTATYDCDSTYLAKIIVSKVYRTTIERRTCQTDAGYYYEHLHRGTGGLLPARFLSDSLTRNDTIASVTGCDSIITLHFYVDSVYDYRQKVAVCQDTVNTQWEWMDEDGISHGLISIADSGNYAYEQKYKTIHGCDSIYGIQIRVKPIYRFDSIYHICENERISWQNKWYAGDSLAPMAGDSVLKPGQYFDTAHYFTHELCDSTYYLVLNVYPIYDTLTQAMACANEGYTWHQTDAFGAYADVVCPASSYHTHWLTCDEAAADLPRPIYDTTMMHYDRMLKTIHGCDSMSHLELVINPAYLFITDTTVCGNVSVKYRGKFFRGQDTTYNDRWQTTAGCDSIYQLRLHVRPVFISHENRTLCDNEIQYHESKNGKDVVWKPGYPIPNPEFEPTDMVYTDLNGCDSIYRYHLTILPSFFHADSDTICTNVSHIFHDARDISPMHEYSMNEYILPFDTIFKDSLTNSHGCDSVYWLYAHIRPTYRDVLLDTICDTETYQWRNHAIAQGNDLYQFTAAGDYTYWDSLVTTEGCDSIYELRLCVHPTYFMRYEESICADEVYAFNGRELNASGFYYDSLTTVSGCDSVYHLYLTVLDTTYEIRFDTVCYGDTVFLSHDTVLQAGFYKDTTPNEWGCHHFLYLYLTYIEPSVPHIVADSMCLSHEAFEIEFAYTGTKPIAYSLYFDDMGHNQGFEDMVNYPIEPQLWDEEGRYALTIRTPWRDDDSTKYPRPDDYPIRLVLDNGYCQHLTKYLDTTIVMSYPYWVTQQRFRDVIAILSTNYNGGYEFSAFQWYRNNEPMPGETHEYLYLPQELEVDTTWYHVRLTRVGETKSYQTCPITIFYDPIDTIAPVYSYLSVVPTCVDASNPVVNILCHYAGEYWIYDAWGKLWKNGHFYPGLHDAFELDISELPANNMYLFVLESEQTVKEPSRSIRILIDGSNCACHPK